MKNLSIKKIALGVFLAGYAASSAFAATSAITTSTIIGNAPTLSSTATPSVAGKYSFSWERKIGATWTDVPATKGTAGELDQNIYAGDRVVIKFNYADVDGDDAEANWTATTRNFPGTTNPVKFVLTAKDAASTAVSFDLTDSTHAKFGTAGKYVAVIPSAAAGKGIEISLAPISQYGDPWVGTQITGDLLDVANTDGPFPPDCTSPSMSADPLCIKPDAADLTVAIVDGTDVYGISYGNGVTTVAGLPGGYTDNTAVNPKIGQTFDYKVWKYDAAATPTLADVSGSYKGAWSFDGTDNAKATSSLAGNAPTTATNVVAANQTAFSVANTYTIGHNKTTAANTPDTGYDVIAAMYKTTPGTIPNAGAQGFTLRVDVKP